jgi:hypothetical protein
LSHATTAAPTLPLEILLPRFARFCISKPVCIIFRKGAIFQKIGFPCQQIADLRDIAESPHNIPLSIKASARAFESNAQEVV